MSPGVASKLVSVSEAATLIEDGSVLGIGGVMDQMVPTELLLGLVRRDARGLHGVTVAAGISVDMLVAGGCMDELSCAIVSFEDLGISRIFRRAVEEGRLKLNEHSELTMVTRLTASMSGLPFLPTRGAIGTDIAKGEGMKMIECPFSGRPLLACEALAPDVSVIHVHAADEAGNARLDQKHIWHDMVIARAARRVIVTAEEIVPDSVFRADPERTLLPGFVVDAVVEAPAGARPTTCRPRYRADKKALREWIDAAVTDEQAVALLERWAAERAG